MELNREPTSEQWLSLTDYASKYRISISTLRRRIKGGQVHYKFDGARYWLVDAAPDQVAAPAPDATTPAETPEMSEVGQKLSIATLTQAALEGDERGEPILSTATRLLNELKRAYSGILHEKEEQMIQLKEEISDLKTLVRVLESDNDRLRRMAGLHRDL